MHFFGFNTILVLGRPILKVKVILSIGTNSGIKAFAGLRQAFAVLLTQNKNEKKACEGLKTTKNRTMQDYAELRRTKISMLTDGKLILKEVLRRPSNLGKNTLKFFASGISLEIA